jgi:hypothetical protein
VIHKLVCWCLHENKTGCWTGLDWTGLDWTELERLVGVVFIGSKSRQRFYRHSRGDNIGSCPLAIWEIVKTEELE